MISSNNLQSKRACLTPPKPESMNFGEKALKKVDVGVPLTEGKDVNKEIDLAQTDMAKNLKDTNEVQLSEATAITEKVREASLEDKLEKVEKAPELEQSEQKPEDKTEDKVDQSTEKAEEKAEDLPMINPIKEKISKKIEVKKELDSVENAVNKLIETKVTESETVEARTEDE